MRLEEGWHIYQQFKIQHFSSPEKIKFANIFTSTMPTLHKK